MGRGRQKSLVGNESYREWPDPLVWFVATTYAVGALGLGAALFLAFQDRFAEHVC